MSSKANMRIGMQIADKLDGWLADFRSLTDPAKPELTPESFVRGIKVALGAEIMKALNKAEAE